MTPEVQAVLAQIRQAKRWTGSEVPADLSDMLNRVLGQVMFDGVVGHDGLESHDPLFDMFSDDFEEANEAVGFLANVVGCLIMGNSVSIGQKH